MVYKTTSVKPVIGRVLRNTRLTDMTYADDILEWIGEGLNRMMIRWRLEKTHKELEVTNHSAELPCGLEVLDAVIYNGMRLRRGTGSIDVRLKAYTVTSTDDLTTYFVSDPEVQEENINSQNYSLIRGDNIKMSESESGGEYFDLQYNHIKTSFETGTIIICYRKSPTDTEGYPLVPDLEETREALFWYVCSKLVFSGYKLPDPIATFDYCDDKATKFFRKAKNIIKEQSIDEKESMVQLFNNLIPPNNYYDTFFIGGEQRKYVDK